MRKLNDTQLVILSTAAQRDDHAVLPIPDSIKAKGANRTKTIDGLIRKGLIEEKRAGTDAPVWRQAEDGQRMMLVATEAGIHAIDGEHALDSEIPNAAPLEGRDSRSRARRTVTARSKEGPRGLSPRHGTKQALLIGLLERKRGATIPEIIAATNWQPHSIRGAISGALKKKLGLNVTSEKDGKRGRVYRITEQG